MDTNALPYSGGSTGLLGYSRGLQSMFPVYQISTLPIKDMSKPTISEVDIYQDECQKFRKKHKLGDNVRAVVINGQFTEDGVAGKIVDYKFDSANKRIRVWVKSDIDDEIKEVYPESLLNKSVLYESRRFKFTK